MRDEGCRVYEDNAVKMVQHLRARLMQEQYALASQMLAAM